MTGSGRAAMVGSLLLTGVFAACRPPSHTHAVRRGKNAACALRAARDSAIKVAKSLWFSHGIHGLILSFPRLCPTRAAENSRNLTRKWDGARRESMRG